jgi:hypothetical protein
MADKIETEKTTITNTEKFVRNMSIFIGIVIIVVLIIIKVNVPTFKVWVLLVAIATVVAFFAAVYYYVSGMGKSNAKKEEEDHHIPRPISLEQAREIAKNCLRNPEYAEYTTACLGENIQQRGKQTKNDIYISKWKGYYSNDDIYILINMNYANLRRTIMINPTPMELEQAKMYLANEEAVMMKEMKIVNPTLGIEQTITEPQKESDKKKKDEDKDL